RRSSRRSTRASRIRPCSRTSTCRCCRRSPTATPTRSGSSQASSRRRSARCGAHCHRPVAIRGLTRRAARASPRRSGSDTPRTVARLPAGTVSFLFSDIEGSTRLLQQLGDAWGDVLAQHRRLLREAVATTEGREVDNQGDAFFFVFGRARDATAAATAGQRALVEHAWPENAEV